LDIAYCLALDMSPTMAPLDRLLASSLGPDRETWGADPIAVESAEAMEALVGGPAQPRR